jgi:hypothetical protein
VLYVRILKIEAVLFVLYEIIDKIEVVLFVLYDIIYKIEAVQFVSYYTICKKLTRSLCAVRYNFVPYNTLFVFRVNTQ